jgi:hypothetical protein
MTNATESKELPQTHHQYKAQIRITRRDSNLAVDPSELTGLRQVLNQLQELLKNKGLLLSATDELIGLRPGPSSDNAVDLQEFVASSDELGDPRLFGWL